MSQDVCLASIGWRVTEGYHYVMCHHPDYPLVTMFVNRGRSSWRVETLLFFDPFNCTWDPYTNLYWQFTKWDHTQALEGFRDLMLKLWERKIGYYTGSWGDDKWTRDYVEAYKVAKPWVAGVKHW